MTFVERLREMLGRYEQGPHRRDMVPLTVAEARVMSDVVEAASDVERAFEPVGGRRGAALYLATTGIEAERRLTILHDALARLDAAGAGKEAK